MCRGGGRPGGVVCNYCYPSGCVWLHHSPIHLLYSSSTSYKRAQHALHETEKVLSSAHCSSEQGKDGEGVKNADRIKSRSPLKMTRSMSLRKKNRPHPPPPKAEGMSSGVTEEYLCQVS